MITHADQQRFVGVYVGDVSARSTSGHKDASSSAQFDYPPSVVFSDVTGLPFAADLHASDLRGSGHTWPKAAQLDTGNGVARLPASLAWHALLSDGASWRTNTASNDHAFSEFADAISLLTKALVGPSDGPLALVVPNGLDPDAQSSLTRALRLRHVDTRLLWRPVSAVLMWIEAHAAELRTMRTSGGSYGHVLTLHLGADGVEFTTLEVVDHASASVPLPARRLPQYTELDLKVRTFGLELLERAIDRVLPGDHGRQWHALWMSGLLPQSGASRGAFNRYPEQVIDALDAEYAECAAKRLSSSQMRRTRSIVTEIRDTFLDIPFHAGVLDAWEPLIESVRKRLPAHIIGTVITGGVASALGQRSTFAPQITSALGVSSDRLLIPQDWGTLLADGAALYLERIQHGEPGYLDTLPIVELLAFIRGEPQWQDLTNQTGKSEDERFIPGGSTWRTTATDLGLAVAEGEKALTLTMFLEGNEYVRQNHSTFPKPVPKKTGVSLSIEMDPGQGLPRLEVLPVDRQIFGGQRVTLDWSRAQDAGKTKDQAASEYPRTNPPLEPRLASARCWDGGFFAVANWRFSSVRDLMEQSIHGRALSMQHIKELTEALRANDQALSSLGRPVHATAVGSDGRLSPTARRQEVLTEFVSRADRALDVDANRDPLLRVLGYCSPNEESAPRLFTMLRALLRKASDTSVPSDLIGEPHLNAIGGCIRDPADVHLYTSVLKTHLSSSSTTNFWLRAMARILQYRDDSLQSTPTELAMSLMSLCADVIENELSKNQAAYIYRHASLSIVYLLRRRRYDDAFLSPESEVGKRIKRSFRDAIGMVKTGAIQPVGGFVDLPQVTQMMIDYIDRKGQGALVGMGVGS